MIFIIDSDKVMAGCMARACRGYEVRVFSNAIEAMAALETGLPELILMEAMLMGPDGWSFLNELISYTDTARIPVVMVSELNLARFDLKAYGVVGVLSKEKMTPSDIRQYAEKYVGAGEEESACRDSDEK
ncbi:response regulator [Candidatus Saccharibacteria bacterium]|nr:response regulator [Candidatus Saccharibacteria bacterium]